ncbi:hypothetical protein JCM8208_005036, partial [Rhodotorula glutinis]
RRDPLLVDSFLASARDDHGFKLARVDHARLQRLVERPEAEGGTLAWPDEADWDGIEVWRLKLGRDALARAKKAARAGSSGAGKGMDAAGDASDTPSLDVDVQSTVLELQRGAVP